MAATPKNTPNLDPISLDAYVKLLDSLDHLDLESNEEVPICFQCHQICMQVFAKQMKFPNHRDFCSAKCFKSYSETRKIEVNKIPKPEQDDSGGQRPIAATPIAIPRAASPKHK